MGQHCIPAFWQAIFAWDDHTARSFRGSHLSPLRSETQQDGSMTQMPPVHWNRHSVLCGTPQQNNVHVFQPMLIFRVWF